MTSSEKPTDTASPPAAGGSLRQRRLAVIGGFVWVIAAGLLVILRAHNWRFSPAVLFLTIGWIGVVVTAAFLWGAGWAAASDGDMGDDEFWEATGRREELLREKTALLKAIKEIEFDHEMGKTSERDVQQLTRYYRRRAIAVLKALEQLDEASPEDLSIDERIARDLDARRALEHKTRARAKAEAAAERKRQKGIKKHRPKGEHQRLKRAAGKAVKKEADKSAKKEGAPKQEEVES